jgi:hypothetical protein
LNVAPGWRNDPEKVPPSPVLEPLLDPELPPEEELPVDPELPLELLPLAPELPLDPDDPLEPELEFPPELLPDPELDPALPSAPELAPDDPLPPEPPSLPLAIGPLSVELELQALPARSANAVAPKTALLRKLHKRRIPIIGASPSFMGFMLLQGSVCATMRPMDKMLRCTVCTWRGTWAEAQAMRVQPVPLPPQFEEIQLAYEEKQIEEEQLGGHHPPLCPQCGHHLLPVKLHRAHAAL